MMPEPTESEASLIPYIDAAGENDNIDAKGPMEWDGAEHSAGLAKDIMAFANSRDGGAIVIGKEERNTNEFVKVGLSDPQAATFETSNVAKWVNARCQPDVNLVCYRVPHEGKVFMVILIKEFQDVPVICTKGYGSGKDTILRQGTLYVRTANAESAPLGTVEQVRTLIGLSTTKRADELLAMFQSMMSGQPLIQQPDTKERYAQEVAAMKDLLEPNLGDTAAQGSWALLFWPTP